jgi:hypothetical protein
MLDVTVIVSLVLAVACAVYGFWAFIAEPEVEKAVKASAENATKAADSAAAATTSGQETLGKITPQAAFSGPTEYLKALASFSEALSKLKRDVAAFVLSLAFLLVATVGAGIEDKVKDPAKETKATTAPARTAPATTTP